MTRPNDLPDPKLHAELREFLYGSKLTVAYEGGETVPLELMDREDDFYLAVFPDGTRHERRIQRLFADDRDRTVWTTLTIACGAPGKSGSTGDNDHPLTKRFGSLPAARNDLDAFAEYYRPTRIGDPHTRPLNDLRYMCAGYHEYTIPLDNPTASQVFESLFELRDWLVETRKDAREEPHQINFCFSGHAAMGGCEHGPALVLEDRLVSVRELANYLVEAQPQGAPERVRLDLYIDCCHSGAIAQAICSNLNYLQQHKDRDRDTIIEIGQIYCACLDDEQCFEFPDLDHGIFTFAFLNECSRKRPEGVSKHNLGLRDIGWYTAGKQHPLLLDFTNPGGMNLKFPSQYHLNRPANARPVEFVQPTSDLIQRLMDPVGEALRIARLYRAICLDTELAIHDGVFSNVEFSRGELKTNARFPFL